jgi:hypothetical protein
MTSTLWRKSVRTLLGFTQALITPTESGWLPRLWLPDLRMIRQCLLAKVRLNVLTKGRIMDTFLCIKVKDQSEVDRVYAACDHCKVSNQYWLRDEDTSAGIHIIIEDTIKQGQAVIRRLKDGGMVFDR